MKPSIRMSLLTVVCSISLILCLDFGYYTYASIALRELWWYQAAAGRCEVFVLETNRLDRNYTVTKGLVTNDVAEVSRTVFYSETGHRTWDRGKVKKDITDRLLSDLEQIKSVRQQASSLSMRTVVLVLGGPSEGRFILDEARSPAIFQRSVVVLKEFDEVVNYDFSYELNTPFSPTEEQEAIHMAIKPAPPKGLCGRYVSLWERRLDAFLSNGFTLEMILGGGD